MRRLLAVAIAFSVACGSPTGLNFRGETDLGSQVDSSLLESSASRLRLGSRIYIATVLNDIFGAAAESTTVALVLNEPAYFGGPCDKYLGDCTEAGQSQFAITPVPTSPRAGLLIRACDKIVSNDTAVLNAVGQVRSDTMPVPAPTSSDLAGLFDLFNPGRAPTAQVLAGLEGIVAEVSSQSLAPLEAWRFTLFSLCTSASWQIP